MPIVLLLRWHLWAGHQLLVGTALLSDRTSSSDAGFTLGEQNFLAMILGRNTRARKLLARVSPDAQSACLALLQAMPQGVKPTR